MFENAGMKDVVKLDINILPLSRIIRHFGIYTFVAFAMYLNITYIYSQSYEFRKTKTFYNLERRGYMIKLLYNVPTSLHANGHTLLYCASLFWTSRRKEK